MTVRGVAFAVVCAVAVLALVPGGVAGQDTATGDADLELTDIEHPEEILLNESLAVTYTIENFGDEPGEEAFVDLLVEGTGRDFDDTDEAVLVPPGETVTGTLVYDNLVGDFDPGDTLLFAVELFETGDSLSGTTGVADEDVDVPELVVDTLEYEQVGPTDDLAVGYTIANVGEEPGEERFVDLAVEGVDLIQDVDENVSVAPGETVDGTLVFDGVEEEFDPGDTIAFAVELFEFGASASGAVEVATVQLAGVDHPGQVSTDESLVVEYAVENTDEATVDDELLLLVEGTQADSEPVTVAPGDTATGTLVYEDTAAFDPGETLDLSVGLAGSGDSTSGTVEVTDNLAIADIEYPGEVPADGALDVAYAVENVGAETVTESLIALLVGGFDDPELADSDADVTVAPGETAEGILTFDGISGEYDPGDTLAFGLGLDTFEGLETGQVAVVASEEPDPGLSVDAPDEVGPDDDLLVEWAVENTGDEELADEVALVVDGETVDSANATADPGETATGTLVFDEVEGEVVVWTVELAGGATESGETDVGGETGPDPGLADVTAPAAIAPGEDLAVEYAVENTGDATLADEVALVVGGETVDSADVTVAAGATEEGTLVFADVTGDTVSFAVELVDGGESVDGTTAVEGDGGLSLSVDGPSVLAPGEDLVVEYAVENTGDGTLADTVEFVADGSPAGADEVSVAPGESTGGSFTVDGETLDPGETVSYTVGLASGGEAGGETTIGTLSGSVAFDGPVETDRETLLLAVTGLDGPAEVAVENLDTDADPSVTTVDGGGTVVVPVADIGGVALDDTVEASLLVGDEVVDTATATVDPGDNDPTAVFAVPGVLGHRRGGGFRRDRLPGRRGRRPRHRRVPLGPHR